MLAAKCNDVTAAKRLIVTSNINEVNAAGDTALHFAAFYDSTAVAEILLGNEADVNLQGQARLQRLDVGNDERPHKNRHNAAGEQGRSESADQERLQRLDVGSEVQPHKNRHIAGGEQG